MNNPAFVNRDLQLIQDTLNELELDYIVCPQKDRITAVFNAPSRIRTFFLDFTANQSCLTLRCICALHLGSDQIRKAEAYHTLVNSILEDSSFVTDYETGELSLYLTHTYDSRLLSQLTVLDMIIRGTRTFLKYAPGLYRVIFDNVCAEDALTECLERTLARIEEKLRHMEKLEQDKEGIQQALEKLHCRIHRQTKVTLHPELLRLLAEHEEEDFPDFWEDDYEEDIPE